MGLVLVICAAASCAAPPPPNEEPDPQAIKIAAVRLAAEAGDAKAQLDLGKAYAFGLGVAQDDTEAQRWYQRAAAQGNSEAKFILELRSLPSLQSAPRQTAKRQAFVAELKRRVARNAALLRQVKNPLIELAALETVQIGDDVMIRGRGRNIGDCILPSLKLNVSIGTETDGVGVDPVDEVAVGHTFSFELLFYIAHKRDGVEVWFTLDDLNDRNSDDTRVPVQTPKGRQLRLFLH